MQIDGGRYFLHEHPDGATSWKLEEIQDILAHDSVVRVTGHTCVHDMTSVDESGPGLVKKAAGWPVCSNTLPGGDAASL